MTPPTPDRAADAPGRAEPETQRADPRPGRARALPPDERRAAITTATLPLLRIHGRDVTTKQIAEAAGIAEGTIFRVFDSKDELIDAAVEQAWDPSNTIHAIEAIAHGDGLDAVVRRCAEILRNHLAAAMDLMFALHRPGHTPDAERDHHRGHRSRSGPAQRPGPRWGRDHPHHRAVRDATVAALAPHAAALACTPERAAHLLRLMTFAGARPAAWGGGKQLDPAEITEVLLHGIALDGPVRRERRHADIPTHDAPDARHAHEKRP